MLSREDFRMLSAGKFAYLNKGSVDWKALEIFVEGAMWSYDYVLKAKKEEQVHLDTIKKENEPCENQLL